MMPRGRPAPSAAARLNSGLGETGVSGTVGRLMTRPGLTARCSASITAIADSASPASRLRLSRLDSSAVRSAPGPSASSSPSTPSISVPSASRLVRAAAMASSMDAVAALLRCSRYASLKAVVPACAASGVSARKLIFSTEVLGGTVTETRSEKSSVGGTERISAAPWATSVDLTSWASVSRLTCPEVREPVTSVSVAVGITRTEVVDS